MPSSTSHNELESTRFRRALSASGLVDGLLLHRLAGKVLADHPTSPEEQDQLFAKLLVKEKRLNPWQVAQLKEGRTKFSLGSYRILDAIGSGGMGHVFKAEHELLGRIEAVKVLPRNKMTPETIAGFRHEIRAQAKLDHPNLVRIYYADRDDDIYFLVSEYVAGLDLRRLIRKRGAMPEQMAGLVIAQAAQAIEYAHQHGLVHRDLKPGNLLMTLDGRVKVADLGLAWFLEEGKETGTPHGKRKVVGTSDYLAPETIRKPNCILPVSDIYSLGCTLYYTLTGKVPFPGGTHLNKLQRHINEAPRDVRNLNPKVSEEMAELIQAMLEKEPSKRISSAKTVADTLHSICTDPSIVLDLIELVKETTEQIKLRKELHFREGTGSLNGGSSTGGSLNEGSSSRNSSNPSSSAGSSSTGDTSRKRSALPETIGYTAQQAKEAVNDSVKTTPAGVAKKLSKPEPPPKAQPLAKQEISLLTSSGKRNQTSWPSTLSTNVTLSACVAFSTLILAVLWKYLQ